MDRSFDLPNWDQMGRSNRIPAGSGCPAAAVVGWVCLRRVSCVSLLRVPVVLLPCYVGSFLFAEFGMLVLVSMSEAPALATIHD